MARRTKHLNSTTESTSSLRNRSSIGKRYKALGRQADGQCFDNFDITHWVDYVRGVVPDLDKEAMTSHLTEGCDPCVHLIAFVNRIRQMSADERAVPEALVELAKAVFQERRSFTQVTDLLFVQRDAERPGSISVRSDWHRWVDEPPSRNKRLREALRYCLMVFGLTTDRRMQKLH